MKAILFADDIFKTFELIFVEVDTIPETLIAKDSKTEIHPTSIVFEDAEPQAGDRVVRPPTDERLAYYAKLDVKKNGGVYEARLDYLRLTVKGVLEVNQSFGAAAVDVKVAGKLLTYELPYDMTVKRGEKLLVPYLDRVEIGDVVSIYRLKQVADKA